MAVVSGEIFIDRSPEAVFDFVADERHEPQYNPRMTGCSLASPPPIGSGTRFAATVRAGRRQVPMTVEFTSFDRPRRLGSHSQMGVSEIDGELTFAPTRSGTTMRWRWRVSPPPSLDRLDGLVAVLGGRQERRVWANLRSVLEASAPGAMHVGESGPVGAPAVLFLHGAGASGAMWSHHVAGLSDRFRCLAPDLPGFGRSNRLMPLSLEATTELVAEVIRTRAPAGKAHVVGLSWGGALAHSLLERHTALVESAVIDGAGVLPWWGGPLIVSGVAALSPLLHTAAVTRLIADSVGMDAQGRADLRAAGTKAFRRAFAEGFRCGPAATEVAAPCPVLLVAGERERHVRPSNAAMAATMAHAVAVSVPGAGHGWIGRRPQLHVRMVDAWLSGEPLPPGLVPEPPSPAATDRLRRRLQGRDREPPDAGRPGGA